MRTKSSTTNDCFAPIDLLASKQFLFHLTFPLYHLFFIYFFTRHRGLERSHAFRRSETSKGWEEKFTDDVILKIHSQINSESDGVGLDALVTSVRLAVHFGHFYLLHAQDAFQGLVQSVPLTSVAGSLEAIKCRPRYERPDYDQHSVPEGFYGDITSKTPLGLQAGSGDSAVGNVQGDVSSSRAENLTCVARRTNQLNAGFHICLVPWKISAAEFERLTGNSERWIHARLESLGYEECSSDDVQVPVELKHEWQVEVIASSSYQVSVQLDKDLRIVHVRERSLRWMHGTLLEAPPSESAQEFLNAKKPLPLDARLKLMTRYMHTCTMHLPIVLLCY